MGIKSVSYRSERLGHNFWATLYNNCNQRIESSNRTLSPWSSLFTDQKAWNHVKESRHSAALQRLFNFDNLSNNPP